MTVATDIQGLADLCKAAAHQAVDAQIDLGPRPAGPEPATLLWDQTSDRLETEVNSLTALAVKLSSAAVLAALEPLKDDLARLATVTQAANDQIRTIKHVSALLTKLASVIDLGLAVLGLAAVPSVASATAVGEKIAALGKGAGG